MRPASIAALTAVIVVAAVGLGRPGLCRAEGLNAVAARDAAAPKVCLVTIENGFGLPIAYASGFLLGEGGLVVTDLASVAQSDAKQVAVRFRDNRRAVAKQFLVADPASGLVVLRLEGNLPNASGLTLSAAPSVAGTEVVAVGWKWAQDVDMAVGRVSNGVLASTVASRVNVSPPKEELTFLRFDADRPEIAGGAPVLDAGGGVVGVLFQVAGTDRAVIIPAGVLRNLLLSGDGEPKALSALPKPLWPVAVEFLPGKPPTASDFAQLMMSIRDRSRCPKCGGKGTVTVQKTIAVPGPGGTVKPAVRTDTETCPECKGEGLIFSEGLYLEFEKVAESGTWLMMGGGVDAKSKEAVVGNVSELLKSIAIVGATYRNELTRRAAADMGKGAYPRGLMVLARQRVAGGAGRQVHAAGGGVGPQSAGRPVRRLRHGPRRQARATRRRPDDLRGRHGDGTGDDGQLQADPAQAVRVGPGAGVQGRVDHHQHAAAGGDRPRGREHDGVCAAAGADVLRQAELLRAVSRAAGCGPAEAGQGCPHTLQSAAGT